MKPLIVFCTTPDPQTSESIASYLVDQRLAACCNILPQVTSVYTWKDNFERDQESLLIIKTAEENYKALENAIIKLHPYEVPEIVALPVTKGSPAYLKWMNESMRVQDGSTD